ncbi:GNAT family N-acetyltransferase [Mesobacillus subterraneus]|uniref:GNAT family N-acetyltransferase n=1 Tax=Mesobacillus subterraneus TaxID=285983 RepID=A0A3R9FKS1_9BACI|nr:GNAT family N-acetyltransferase [Mesobacillus subterraneus]RSD28704.1 GNAT family N-acetyltransferase [Mesobacillus subterraneus]
MDLKIIRLTSNNFSRVVLKKNTELPDSDALNRLEKKATGDTILSHWGVVTPNGDLVGFGEFATGAWDPVLKPGTAQVTIRVASDWRNRGVGSLILQEIERFAHKNMVEVLLTGIQDTNDKDLRWAEKQGFMKTWHTFESRLELTGCMIGHHSDLKPRGIRFTTLADYPQTNDYYKRFWDFWWELVSDVPGMEGKPQPDLEYMLNLTKDFDKQGFILAVEDDRWVALSIVIKESEEACYNSMTGVSRDYRGRGLAQAIKRKAIEYALQKNIKYIRTHNDSRNASMLAVNKKLGYQQEPGIYGLQKNIGR